MKRLLGVLGAAAVGLALALADGCGPFWVNPYITVQESPLNWMEIHYYNTLDSSRKSTRRVSLSRFLRVLKYTKFPSAPRWRMRTSSAPSSAFR